MSRVSGRRAAAVCLVFMACGCVGSDTDLDTQYDGSARAAPAADDGANPRPQPKTQSDAGAVADTAAGAAIDPTTPTKRGVGGKRC